MLPPDPDDRTREHPPAEHVDACITAFESAMRNEILCNAFKGDWRTEGAEVLTREVVYHAHKLLVAVVNDDRPAILEYAADCGNLAMYVADTAKALDVSLLSPDPAEYREDAPDRGAMLATLKAHAGADHATVLDIIRGTPTDPTDPTDIPF